MTIRTKTRIGIGSLILAAMAAFGIIAFPSVGRPIVLFGENGAILIGADLNPRYANEVAKARAAGLPTEMSEVFPLSIRESDNAAPIYQQIHEAFNDRVTPTMEITVERSYIEPLPPAWIWPQAQAMLGSRKHFLRIAHLAADRPYCVAPHDFEHVEPARTEFPLLQKMRQCARLITLESQVMAIDGHPVEAVNNQALGFRIANHAATDPTLAAYLAATSVDALTFRGLQRILITSRGAPAVATAVEQAVRKHRPRSLEHAMRSEIAFGIGEFDYMMQYGPTAPDHLPKNRHYQPFNRRARHPAIFDVNGALYVKLMRQEIPTCDRPYSESAASAARMEIQLEETQTIDGLLCSVLLPNVTGTVARHASALAMEDITAAAAAVFVWKSKYGRFPNTLIQAMNVVPSDPFDLKPLRYRRHGSGFVVYSVGRTLAYDGSPVKPGRYEEVFRYPDEPQSQPRTRAAKTQTGKP